MKKLLLLALCLFSSGPLVASDCKDCAAIEKLTKKIEAYKFGNDEDLVNAEESIRMAIPYFEKFLKVGKKAKNRNSIFENLTKFAFHSGPFDIEAQVSAILGEILKKEPGLKKDMDKNREAWKLESAVYRCKSDLLDRNVDIQLCYLSAGASGGGAKSKAQVEKMKQCPVPVNYESCLKEGK